MPLIMDLGYIELGVPDIKRSADYYSGVFGATMVDDEGSQSAHLSLGNNPYCLALKSSEATAMGAVGLQLRPPVTIEDVTRRLNDMGLSSEIRSDSRPGVARLMEVVLPGGHKLELFEAMAPAPRRPTAAGISPRRLGHVALLSTEAARLVEFLTKGLECWVTDWFEDRATFLTCNRDHHAFNIVNAPVCGVHHVAFELSDARHHFDAADLLTQSGIPMLWGPSRHTAGHNIASYHRAPEGSLIELYSDMDIYIPELGIFEPRPFHEDRPQKPKVWNLSNLSAWHTEFAFDLAKG